MSLLAPNKPETDATVTEFRLKRFQYFLRVLESIDTRSRALKILDVGGLPSYWTDKISLIKRPVEITLLNLEAKNTPGFVSIAGDARAMSQFSDNQFDIVHSNSVIEHVGQWKDMMATANEIARVAPAYFVQTPYYWFPIEPHSRTFFLHWLPESIRFRVVMARKCGPFWSKAETVDQAMRTIQSSTLLDKKMLSALFPDAEIISEKFMGFTKSLMALRIGQIAQ